MSPQYPCINQSKQKPEKDRKYTQSPLPSDDNPPPPAEALPEDTDYPDVTIIFTLVPANTSRQWTFAILPPWEGLSVFLLREFGVEETDDVRMWVVEEFEGDFESVPIRTEEHWELWIDEAYSRLEMTGESVMRISFECVASGRFRTA